MPKTDHEFQQLLDDGVTHRSDIKTLEDRKALIDADILAHIFESEGRYMTPDGAYKVQDGDRGTWGIGARTTKTIDPAKLIALGVAIDIIDQATTTNTGSPFLTFYPKREKKEKEKKK